MTKHTSTAARPGSHAEDNWRYFGADYMRTGKAAVLTKERTRDEVDGLVSLLGLTGRERLLDVGCGWGRHVVEFAARGYEVVGIDQSEAMIGRARALLDEQSLGADLIVGDMAAIPFVNEFDILLCLFGSFGYADTDDDSLQILIQMRRALTRSGKLCLELWNRDKYIRKHGVREFHRHESVIVLEKHDFDPVAGRMTINRSLVEAGDIRDYILSVRLYTCSELISLLTAAGFESISAFGNFGGGEFSVDSPKLILVGNVSSELSAS